MWSVQALTHYDITHWIVDYRFKALSLVIWPSPACFLEPEVIIFGKEGGAGWIIDVLLHLYPNWITGAHHGSDLSITR